MNHEAKVKPISQTHELSLNRLPKYGGWQNRPSNTLHYELLCARWWKIISKSLLSCILYFTAKVILRRLYFLSHAGLWQLTISETCKKHYLWNSIHDQLRVSLWDRSSTLAPVRSTVQTLSHQKAAFPFRKEVVCISNPTESTRQCHLEFLPNPSQTAWS